MAIPRPPAAQINVRADKQVVLGQPDHAVVIHMAGGVDYLQDCRTGGNALAGAEKPGGALVLPSGQFAHHPPPDGPHLLIHEAAGEFDQVLEVGKHEGDYTGD